MIAVTKIRVETALGVVEKRVAMTRVFVGGAAGGGAAQAYVHTQSSPAATWTINHNLGFRPTVSLLDAGGNAFGAEVAHPSANQTIVSLVAPLAGSARLT